MDKTELHLSEVTQKIKEFYDVRIHRFLTLNGVALDEQIIEVQWIFSYYDSNEMVVFYSLVKIDETVPSIVDIIPSAIISQRELVDMFGLKVQDSEGGLYLDEDSLQKPLSLGCNI